MAVWALLPVAVGLPGCCMAVEACSGAILCIIVWRQAADRVRIVLVAWLVGPDAAAYLCYDLAYNYHLAGGELVECCTVICAIGSRWFLLREPHPFISVVGYPVTFQCPSPNFYCFLWDLSSVYFLSMLISRYPVLSLHVRADSALMAFPLYYYDVIPIFSCFCVLI
jgi:hypothetical protein